MYKDELIKLLDNKAEWKEVNFVEYRAVLGQLNFHPENLYIRDSLDSECTEWTGILQYNKGTNIAYFKFAKRGELSVYYINTKVIDYDNISCD